MAENLTERLAGRRCADFNPRPMYFQDGDYVTYFFKDEIAEENRVDELLTVYRSIKTGEMVGCKIKGVRRILQMLGRFGVVIQDEHNVLGILFVGAALILPERREEHEKVGERVGSVPLDSKEIQSALAA